ncbi:hypothetical protein, partial [Escherichia coli]|uniref:hypothetical protein n=1 Tax=Escherichia coli TaxID=562 RepID=UPI00138708B4
SMERFEENQKSFVELAKHLSRLSSEYKQVVWDIGTSLAGVSLKVSREFVEVVPEVAEVFAPEDLKLWAEIGRRLAIANPDAGMKFFAQGARDFANVPEDSRSLAFQICLRQMILSSNIALETYQEIPKLRETL